MLCKTKKIIICVLVISVFSVPSSGFTSPISGGLPKIEDLYKSGDLNKFMVKYRENYDLDMVKFSVFKEPLGLMNSLASFLFYSQVGLCVFLTVIFYYSFELDFFALFKGFINTLIGEFKTGIFDELMMIAIIFVGTFYIINILSNRKTQIWTAIIQTVAIIAVSYAFFSNPSGMFQGIDDFSKGLSTSILTGTYRADSKGTPQSAVTAAANEIWNMFVHKPWQLLEFGDEETAEEYEEEILSLSPGSEERERLVENLSEEKDLFTTRWGTKRLGFMVLYFFPLLIQFVGMVALCILMLGYQALLIVLAIMGVFVFLLSLIPFFGLRTVGSWLGKVLSCSATKVAVTFILALLLSFNSAIFKLAGTYGWLIALTFQLIVTVMIVLKRKMFLDMFSVIRLAPQGKLNGSLNKDYNLEHKMFNNINRKYSKINKNKDFESFEDEERTDGETEQGNEKNDGKRASGSKRRNGDFQNRARISSADDDKEDIGYINTVSSDRNFGDRGDYSRLVKTAEDILERQYEILKQDAEIKAEKTDKEAEYPYFVQQVDTREKLGTQRFDDREISYVIKQIENIQKSGGNVNQLYKKETIQTNSEIKRPESVIKVYMDGNLYDLNKENGNFSEVSPEESNLQISRMTKDMNDSFNTKYDTEFMNSLVKKYGQAQVKYVLDRMKKMQKGEIKNPGGYLTQSLKNNRIDNSFKMRGSEEKYEK